MLQSEIRLVQKMVFSAIEHERTSRAVEKQIEVLILEGVLRAGDKLPGERELSHTLEVSRPIVREALATLEQRELLTARHGEGTFVAKVIGTVFAPNVVELIGTNAKAKGDYLEYRREIESLTASMAAQRATDVDKTLLSKIMQSMEAAHERQIPEEEAAVDVEFHNAIGECAHNIVLLHTLRSCYQLLADDVFLNRQLIYAGVGVRQRLFEQHQMIFTAVMDGNSDQAAQASRNHIDFVIAATREAETYSDRNSVSALRLAQRQRDA